MSQCLFLWHTFKKIRMNFNFTDNKLQSNFILNASESVTTFFNAKEKMTSKHKLRIENGR